MNLSDFEPILTEQELMENIEMYRAQRIRLHCQYLNYKRQERYWRDLLKKHKEHGDSCKPLE